jgi:DNA repair protein SbcD/Mre11
VKFIHAADIHLDSPLVGLAAYDGAPLERLRGATRRALEGMVDLALDEAVDFVVISGDLYDGDWRDFNTGLFFGSQMARLGARDIPVFLLHGNHDAESQITKRLPLPESVKVFSARKPESFELPEHRTVLHGQSFRHRETTDNLAAAYPRPRPGWFNIGVLHTALDGREGHAPYAPCDLAGLVNHGFDYWALGHVHGRELLHEHPHVLFPGNLQGRHVRETGPKGCSLVTVAEGRVVSCEHRCVDALRWALVEADLTGAADLPEMLVRVRAALDAALSGAEGRPLACRVRLVGETALHGRLVSRRDQVQAEVRALAFEVGVDALWIEKVKLATWPPGDRRVLAERSDALGGLMRSLAALSGDAEFLGALGDDLADLLARLPPEALEGEAGEALASLKSGEGLARLAAEAGDLLLSRLSGGEAGA